MHHAIIKVTSNDINFEHVAIDAASSSRGLAV